MLLLSNIGLLQFSSLRQATKDSYFGSKVSRKFIVGRLLTAKNTLYVTVFGKTNRLARKTNFFFVALLPFMSSEDAAVQI